MPNLFSNFIKLILWSFKSPCTHPNAITQKWVNRDGVPMIDRRCPDCGECRYGEVRDADPRTWGIEDD